MSLEAAERVLVAEEIALGKKWDALLNEEKALNEEEALLRNVETTNPRWELLLLKRATLTAKWRAYLEHRKLVTIQWQMLCNQHTALPAQAKQEFPVPSTSRATSQQEPKSSEEPVAQMVAWKDIKERIFAPEKAAVIAFISTWVPWVGKMKSDKAKVL